MNKLMSVISLVLTVCNCVMFKDLVIDSFSFESNVERYSVYAPGTSIGLSELINEEYQTGTLTFIDPYSHIAGMLSHPSHIEEIDNVTIHPAPVVGINKGVGNVAGTKEGSIELYKFEGFVKKEGPHGVYGFLIDIPQVEGMDLVEIGYKNEIRKGKATLLTVVDGRKVEEFEIEIIDVTANHELKGFDFKITDERLLDTTGGVVKGMSGSPIFQNGRLIGGVSAVYLDDHTTGLGVYIETMLEEAGIEYK